MPSEDISGLAERLRDVLLASGRFTPDAIERIHAAMSSLQMSFADAAIHLGLITWEEYAEAVRAARSEVPPAPQGIIQRALARIPHKGGLPMRSTTQVRASSSLVMVNQPESDYSERIRALRTELSLLSGNARGAELISVLSPCRGEGRTKLCAELAIAFAQLGRRTLLVDADLRRPQIHTLFEAENNFGLAQALAEGGALNTLGVEHIPQLSIITAGPVASNPLELVSSPYFEMAIVEWRNAYDIVLIDTPPITEYSDGIAIASLAEEVLVVTRANSTPHKNLREMLRRLASTQSRIVGAVINSF
jgi:protein-tyrosine kinase